MKVRQTQNTETTRCRARERETTARLGRRDTRVGDDTTRRDAMRGYDATQYDARYVEWSDTTRDESEVPSAVVLRGRVVARACVVWCGWLVGVWCVCVCAVCVCVCGHEHEHTPLPTVVCHTLHWPGNAGFSASILYI